MSAQLGTAQRSLRVVIIGAGPSGFYAAGALLKEGDGRVSVDMFERLPAPHGLVRYGVAPDHQNIKAVARTYDRTAESPHFRFFGNVEMGQDVTHDDLRRHYDAIIYAVGAQSDRKLNIPGEGLPNSLSATEFVAWYNGHPDFVHRAPDLDVESAVVVGVGNVAMDVARILAKSADELRKTDIADHALEVLAASRVQDVHVLSRRGPAQVKFTNAEVREFGHLDNADVVIDPAELHLDPASSAEVRDDTAAQKNMDYLRAYVEIGQSGRSRRVHFRFLLSPVEILGDEQIGIVAVRVERNELRPTVSGYINAYGTGAYETIPAGLVLRAVGYKGLPLAGVPYDTRAGVIPNDVGRVIDLDTGAPIAGEYVVGWAKRGPTGVIGTNKPDAVETVNSLLEDLRRGRLAPAPVPNPAAVERLLAERRIRFVSAAEWRILDTLEQEAGRPQGRPRVKYVRLDEMLRVLEERERAGAR